MEKITIFTTEEKLSGGPAAVARSLMAGFKKLKINYNHNPKFDALVNKTVVVLSNPDALRRAIELKRKNKIKKLLAGPNLMMLPSQVTSIIDHRLIDIYLHPCKQIIKWWVLLDPKFSIKHEVWFAGVDPTYWKIPAGCKKNRVLIYQKKCPDELVKNTIKHLRQSGFSYQVIKYGHYSASHYKSLLTKVKLMVFLSESESQGIALFEAWSCNVPTLVWDRGFGTWKKYKFTISSSPYLSKATGLSFQNAYDFEQRLKSMWQNLNMFRPRDWIISHGTDTITAKNLVTIIKKIN